MTGWNIQILGKLPGSIEIMQKCTGGAKCIIDANISATADALLDVSVSQEVKDSLMNFFSLKQTDITTKQEIVQKITNSLSVMCSTNVSQIQNNNSFVFGTGAYANSIIIGQEADAQATCPINMTAASAATAKGKMDASQLNDTALGLSGILKYVAYAVVAVIVAVILVVIIKAALNKKK